MIQAILGRCTPTSAYRSSKTVAKPLHFWLEDVLYRDEVEANQMSEWLPWSSSGRTLRFNRSGAVLLTSGAIKLRTFVSITSPSRFVLTCCSVPYLNKLLKL